MAEQDDSRPIVIVGSGMAGLSAALHLAERGLRPLLLEADPRYCGGRVAGGDPFEWQGFRFRDDHGVHAIWSSYRNLQAMLTRRAIRPMLVPAREESWVYKDGPRVKRTAAGSAIRHSPVPAPFHYLNLFVRPRFLAMLRVQDWASLALVWYALNFGLSVDPLREGQPLEGLWLSDLLKGWSPTLRAFFVGLMRSGLSAYPEEIPLAGFIAFLRFYTLLRRDAWNMAYLPADGKSSLVDPLLEQLAGLGVLPRMGVRVTHLVPQDSGWDVHWQETASGAVGSAAARQVVLAADAPNTAAILRASPALAERAAALYWPRGAATAVVRCWYDRAPHRGPEAGILSGDMILDNFFWLHRIQSTYVHWGRASGGSAVEAHIYGPPALLAEPDATLLARAITDLQSAFPELRGHRVHQTIRRNPHTHTLFGLGPAERHLGVATLWPDLFCCGDWVRDPNPAFFLERACVTGIKAANEVLTQHDQSPWPLLDYPEPERLSGAMERAMLWGRRVMRRHRKG